MEKKGRTKAELDQVIEWLTGCDESALSSHLAAGTTFESFFADARLNPHASLITGLVWGASRRRRRSVDADELAKGKTMDKILRARNGRSARACRVRLSGRPDAPPIVHRGAT